MMYAHRPPSCTSSGIKTDLNKLTFQGKVEIECVPLSFPLCVYLKELTL